MFDDATVRFSSYGAGAAGATGTGGAANAVEVDFVGLWGFVIDYCGDVGDVEAAGGEVGGEKVGAGASAEGGEGGDSLSRVGN